MLLGGVTCFLEISMPCCGRSLAQASVITICKVFHYPTDPLKNN
jgi:hypothetical protein